MIGLKKIRIDGQYFDIPCTLDLLEGKNNALVIYGKNGICCWINYN